jgi:hypothetical protein
MLGWAQVVPLASPTEMGFSLAGLSEALCERGSGRGGVRPVGNAAVANGS